MRRAWVVVVAAGVVVAAAAYVGVTATAAGGSSDGGDEAKATLRDAGGVKVGTVKLEQRGATVRVKVKVDGSVPAGFHGFHVHTVGACVAPFTTAGGHFNPGGATHGDHAGDLPVLYIGPDGRGEATVATDRFALSALFDADGSAVILHAGRDNLAHIPTDRYDPDPDAATLATGDAGARVACGVVEAS